MFDFLDGLFDAAEDMMDSMFSDDGTNDLAGAATSYLADTDGDMIMDAVVTEGYYDMDGNGVDETILTDVVMDTDGDGVFDTVHMADNTDTNGDGIIDTSVEYRDNDMDGTIDSSTVTVGYDTDGDGIFDTFEVGVDHDGDTIIDEAGIYQDFDQNGILEPADDSLMLGEAPAYDNFDPSMSDSDAVIGDPAEAMEKWHCQETGSSCAVAAQEFAAEVLTGEEFNEADLRDIGEENGWYAPDGGTLPDDVGKILEELGLDVERSWNNTIQDIEDCLANNGEVIVGVDSSEIWEGESDEWFGPGMGADHAIQVIGIDKTDPDNPMVILNDSGVANGCGAMVSLEVFMEAWEDSGYFMTEVYA